MAEGDCCENSAAWWCARPIETFEVSELARTVDWTENYYPALTRALLKYPNRLPLRVCVENGSPELIDGKHRLGAAVKRGQFFIRGFTHNHDREDH